MLFDRIVTGGVLTVNPITRGDTAPAVRAETKPDQSFSSFRDQNTRRDKSFYGK
jgi:hypothetical protein